MNRSIYLHQAFFPERWGFLRAPFGTLVDAVASWNKDLYSDVRTIPLQDDIFAMMELVKNRTVPRRNYLITTTRSEWNACFSNSLFGDLTSLIGYMSEVLSCDGLEITVAPPPKRIQQFLLIFLSCRSG